MTSLVFVNLQNVVVEGSLRIFEVHIQYSIGVQANPSATKEA